VQIEESNEKEKEFFFNKLRILVPLTHKKIIRYKEAFYDKETRAFNMVIEYVDGGDLSMKIKIANQNKAYLKENLIN
jgi:serine/threonine protein kinase